MKEDVRTIKISIVEKEGFDLNGDPFTERLGMATTEALELQAQNSNIKIVGEETILEEIPVTGLYV